MAISPTGEYRYFLIVFAWFILFVLIVIFSNPDTSRMVETQRGANREARFYLSMGLMFLLGASLASYQLFADWPDAGMPQSGPLPLPRRPEVLPGVLERLGDALMIAALIAIAVDQFLKRQLLTEVAQDVLSFAAGYDLPSPLKQRVTDLIKAENYRGNFVMTLSLKPLSASNGVPSLVRLTMDTTYVVHNLIGEPRPYKVKTAIERSPYNSVEPSRLLELKLGQGPSVSLAHIGWPSGDAPYLHYETEAYLAAAGAPGLTVTTKRSAVYEDKWYYILDILATTLDVTIFTTPYPGFRWRVSVPQLTVQPADDGTGTWRCDGVFLPGQFVRITWTKEGNV